MRIAWFANIDFQEGNAANSRIRILANGLKANGNQVFLFFLSSTIFNSNAINKKSKGFYDGIYFNYLSGSVYRSRYLIQRAFRYFLAIINSSILLIKKRKHFDVVFIYSPRFLFFAHIYFLTKILKIPLILEKTELEEITPTNNLIKKLISFTEKLDAYIYKYTCSHLIVISSQLKQHYLKYLPANKISIVPIVVDLKRFEIAQLNQPANYSVGYLGSFGEKDGVKGLIKSFKAATTMMPNLKLKLIGFNQNRRETNLVLRSNQLNGQVEKSGQITYEQVPQWLAKCDLLIMNRTNQAYSHYGFPTKLGEYLATGIPTITTKVGDIDKYLEHNVNTFMIAPDESDLLTDAILLRYKNYEHFNKIGLNGREVAQSHFDYNKYIPVLQSVFEGSIKNRR